MTSPIEAVAKAIAKEDWGHGRAGGPWSEEVWERLLKGYREVLASDEAVFIKEAHYLHGIFRKARAALLALAEVKLPEQMEIENGGLAHTRVFHFDEAFRLVLRAIAEEQPR